MRIQNNIMALNTHRAYTANNDAVAKSAEKLSSGYRINRAGDDAAGLAISEKMRAQIRGLNMATKNSQDAISLVQTAEGALQETHNILQRMRELAVQSASDTNEKVIDRGALQQEFAQLQSEINDIASKTVFNDQKLIDGTFADKVSTAKLEDATVNTVGGKFKENGGQAILANNVKAGTYEFGVIQVTTGAKIGASPAVGSFTAGNVVGGDAGITGLTFKTPTAAMDSDLNGDWQIKVQSGNDGKAKIIASNMNGKSFEGIIDETGTTAGRITVKFNGLATFEFASDTNHADKAKAYDETTLTSIMDGQTFSVSGAQTPEMGETKFYATMTGAANVELRVGDTSVTFDNGISLEFGSALSYSDIAVAYGAKGDYDDNIAHAKDSAFFGQDAKGAKATGKITVSQRSSDGIVIQTGANEGDELKINIDKMNTRALGVALSSIGTRTNASHAITDVNNAINQVSTQRAALGALQNRLDHKIANLKVSSENLSAAESRIRDVDMASEMSTFTKNNILAQAATAMLAQANNAPQNVLSLLR